MAVAFSHPTDPPLNSQASQIAKLARKAQEYLDALFLEINAPLKLDIASSLQRALLQDFIEVHNFGRRSGFDLPSDYAEIISSVEEE